MIYNETKWRTIIKTASYRFWTSAFTVLLVYLFFGALTTGLLIGGIEVGLKTAFYFFHERAWNKIKFGRKCAYGYDDFEIDEEEISV